MKNFFRIVTSCITCPSNINMGNFYACINEKCPKKYKYKEIEYKYWNKEFPSFCPLEDCKDET